MRFSVVIPTCDRPTALAACLTRLAPGAQTLAPADYEVIVADDGVATVAAQLSRDFPSVRWTRGPRRGPAANRNHGASLARGDWLVFTDDDCLPTAGWLAALAQSESAQNVRVLEGRTRAPGPRMHPLDSSPVNEQGGHLWSCNFAIDRHLFATLGGFDERFRSPAMEDVELHARLQARAERITFVPDALVEHPWKRIADWPGHYRKHLAARRLMEAIHPGRGFPSTPGQVLRFAGRVFFTEHLAFLVRHPQEGFRRLPALWLSLMCDVWFAWRKPAAALPTVDATASRVPSGSAL